MAAYTVQDGDCAVRPPTLQHIVADSREGSMDQRDEGPIPANALDGNVVALLDSKPDDKLLLLRRCELRVESVGAGQMAAGYLKRDTFGVSETDSTQIEKVSLQVFYVFELNAVAVLARTAPLEAGIHLLGGE